MLSQVRIRRDVGEQLIRELFWSQRQMTQMRAALNNSVQAQLIYKAFSDAEMVRYMAYGELYHTIRAMAVALVGLNAWTHADA